jgi:hypothetical protein
MMRQKEFPGIEALAQYPDFDHLASLPIKTGDRRHRRNVERTSEPLRRRQKENVS